MNCDLDRRAKIAMSFQGVPIESKCSWIVRGVKEERVKKNSLKGKAGWWNKWNGEHSHINGSLGKQVRSLTIWGRRRVKQRRENKRNCRYGKESAYSQHLVRSRIILRVGRNWLHLWMPLEACTVSDYVVWKEGKILKGHSVMIKKREKDWK